MGVDGADKLNKVYYEALDKYSEDYISQRLEEVKNSKDLGYQDLHTEELLALAAYEIDSDKNELENINIRRNSGVLGSQFSRQGFEAFARWSFGLDPIQKRSSEALEHDLRGLEHELGRPPISTDVDIFRKDEYLTKSEIPYRTISNKGQMVEPEVEDAIVDWVYSADFDDVLNLEESGELSPENKDASFSTFEVVNTMLRGRYFDWMAHENVPEGLDILAGVNLDVFESQNEPRSLIDYYDGDHDEFLRDN